MKVEEGGKEQLHNCRANRDLTFKRHHSTEDTMFRPACGNVAGLRSSERKTCSHDAADKHIVKISFKNGRGDISASISVRYAHLRRPLTQGKSSPNLGCMSTISMCGCD